MSEYILSPSAVRDLDEIWDHYAIELQNPDAADRVCGEIFEAMDRLARTPGMGHLRTDLSPREPLCFLHVRKYLIIYRRDDRPIQIVRVIHGNRDVAAILDS